MIIKSEKSLESTVTDTNSLCIQKYFFFYYTFIRRVELFLLWITFHWNVNNRNNINLLFQITVWVAKRYSQQHNNKVNVMMCLHSIPIILFAHNYLNILLQPIVCVFLTCLCIKAYIVSLQNESFCLKQSWDLKKNMKGKQMENFVFEEMCIFL